MRGGDHIIIHNNALTDLIGRAFENLKMILVQQKQQHGLMIVVVGFSAYFFAHVVYAASVHSSYGPVMTSGRAFIFCSPYNAPL